MLIPNNRYLNISISLGMLNGGRVDFTPLDRISREALGTLCCFIDQ